MKRGEGYDRVTLLGDEQQEQGNQDSENRDEKSGKERLDHIGLPLVLVQVVFLWWGVKDMQKSCSDKHTKLGQKAEMFWMETRPTRSEIGKTQKIVEALWKIMVKAGYCVEPESRTRHRDQ